MATVSVKITMTDFTYVTGLEPLTLGNYPKSNEVLVRECILLLNLYKIQYVLISQ